MAVTHNIGFHMKQKELTKTFIMISLKPHLFVLLI